MVLKKTQKAGEWWICNETQTPVYIVGMDPEGDPVFMENAEDRPSLDLLSEFTKMHLPCPECTGFDWVPPKPAESPDDWVVQDRCKFRPECDEFRWKVNANHWTPWTARTTLNAKHGEYVGNVMAEIRCRRKDLPPIVDAAPKSPWQIIEISGRKYEIREAQEVPRG